MLKRLARNIAYSERVQGEEEDQISEAKEQLDGLISNISEKIREKWTEMAHTLSQKVIILYLLIIFCLMFYVVM